MSLLALAAAKASPGVTTTAVALAADLLARLDRLEGTDVLADLGRLNPGSPALPLARAARLLVLVCRPTLAELQHLAHRVAALREASQTVGLVLVGGGPYPPAEVARTLGVQVLGTLPVDRHGAGLLGGTAAGMPGLRRTRLLRAARTLADDLAGRLATNPTDEAADSAVAGSPAVVALPATDNGEGWSP